MWFEIVQLRQSPRLPVGKKKVLPLLSLSLTLLLVSLLLLLLLPFYYYIYRIHSQTQHPDH